MSCAVFVVGPAGSGKSTLCASLMSHFEASHRSAHLLNLDPAAQAHETQPSKNICDLISVDDVMEELELGPNGALIYCMEYLAKNLEFLEDDPFEEFLVVDCPGQIELYTHNDAMLQIIGSFVRRGYRVCALYCLESHFVDDTNKFVAGALSALSAMIRLELPHINVLTKMDLLECDLSDEHSKIHTFLNADISALEGVQLPLTRAIGRLIDDFNMVSFVPVNIKDEESLENLIYQIDTAVQYGEEVEPKEHRDKEPEE